MDHLTLSNNNLDRSNGRATMIGGTLYYSPNSRRSFHGVYNLERNDVANHFLVNDILGAWLKYLVPWNESLGWLGLLPFEVLYEGPLFGCLHSFHINHGVIMKGIGYHLYHEDATSWLRLHYNLHDLVQALQRSYGFNFDPPVAPENGTFDEVFTTIETAFNNLKSWRTLRIRVPPIGNPVKEKDLRLNVEALPCTRPIEGERPWAVKSLGTSRVADIARSGLGKILHPQ
ncbi:hypothetical protein BDQ17DRAFT_1326920 [Cyathus striatus]|nr:hypothetical protein BDQ17DRAFT_1326920 [Cyathus striatus]